MEKRRLTTYMVLEEVFDKGVSLKESYEKFVEGKTKHESDFVKELAYGVARNKLLLDCFFMQATGKEMTNVFKKAKHLLRMAVYEIVFMKHKDYAVLSSIVDIAKEKLKNQDKFVNWALREFLRNSSKLEIPGDADKQSISFTYSFPQHFVEYLISEVGKDRAVQLMKFYNEKPQTHAFNIETGEYREFLPGDRLTSHEYILDPVYLNIFRFLQMEHIKTVLDCCAAPGGKSFLLKSFVKSAKITAIDKDGRRIERMKENVERLKLTGIKTETVDLLKSDLGKVFDLVIVDAPCTATGTIRKNPDVKYNYKKKLETLRETQLSMLKKADEYVKDGGSLLYMTCSILNAENQEIAEEFIKSNSDYKVYSQFFSFGMPFNGGYGVLLRKSGGEDV
ncbi:MAG: transcription antitermination factor NusB [bacterium]|nr:transcription antitermination factor NusB [bacterium]